jgi:hypothetical protein
LQGGKLSPPWNHSTVKTLDGAARIGRFDTSAPAEEPGMENSYEQLS